MINPFVNYTTPSNEQQIYSDMFVESVQWFGQDMAYIPRTLVKEDLLFHEDIMSSFDSHFTIEMYIDSYEIYQGQPDFIASIGLQIDDKIKLSVSSARFLEVTGLPSPLEGDLIWFPTGKSLFEIQFVEDESEFFQLGKLPVFKLSCVLFKYNGNDMNTGHADVDSFEKMYDSGGLGKDPFANNDIIQEEGEEIIVWDPTNPFGSI